MIKEFVAAWDKNKGNLEEHFKTHKQSEYSEYVELVKFLFNVVINPEMSTKGRSFYTDDITVIDHGDYQGTQIFILHMSGYQPSVADYVYTSNYYGSCSGCDTLQGINGYSSSLPSKGQVKDYMSLCLNLLQSCVWMIDGSTEEGVC